MCSSDLLEHVVTAPAVGDIPVRVDADHVTRDVPFASEGLAGFLFSLPIPLGEGVATDPEVPDFIGCDLRAILVEIGRASCRERV